MTPNFGRNDEAERMKAWSLLVTRPEELKAQGK